MPETISIRPLTDADRLTIGNWRYDGELAIYSPGAGAMDLREPDHVALTSHARPLLGYGTLGAEARVRGGMYEGGDSPLDVGLGLAPALVGAGHGVPALEALLRWVTRERGATCFRATVAAVNPRATAIVHRAGFVPTHEFVRAADGRRFIQYERTQT